jgi:hypothetical protein
MKSPDFNSEIDTLIMDIFMRLNDNNDMVLSHKEVKKLVNKLEEIDKNAKDNSYWKDIANRLNDY